MCFKFYIKKVVLVGQEICKLDSLEELSCHEFVVKKGGLEKDAFLIYFNKRVYAYENSCPHTGVSLNWQAGQFFSVDGLYIQCSLHGALFEPVKGVCIQGPCRGESLMEIDVVIENNTVYLSEKEI